MAGLLTGLLTDGPATEIGAKMSPACTPSWILGGSGESRTAIDHRSRLKCQIGLSAHRKGGFNVSLAI